MKNNTNIDYPINNDQELRDLIMEEIDKRLNGGLKSPGKVKFEQKKNKKGKKKSKKKNGEVILEETEF